MDSEYHLVVRDDPKSPAAEAIRSLRTNLQFVGLDRPLKSVLVTSADPSEGKTSISANLAVSLAQSGTRTILVGADLRKPSLHRVFGVSNRTGLTSVLLGQSRLSDTLEETDVENLKILNSGPIPPNPAELLGSKAMKGLVAELEEAADMVIFDATPALAVTDAVLLANAVDGVLLVVSMNKTPREVVRRAKDQLLQVRANLVGVVANRVEARGRSKYYYYYYYGEGNKEAAAAGGDGVRRRKEKKGMFGALSRLFSRG